MTSLLIVLYICILETALNKIFTLTKINDMDLKAKLLDAVKNHSNVITNSDRKTIIQEAVDNKEAIIAESGALSTWTPVESSGRSPKDTVMVKRSESEHLIDWTSPNNIPIDEETFNIAFEEGIAYLNNKKKVYVMDRVVGADSNYAMPVKVIGDFCLNSTFL
jgi:phosphoenolpyruvate carboxykinase (ATP)